MIETDTTRRRFITAGAAVAATAGCLGALPDAGSRSGGDADRSLHLSLSHLDGPLRDRYVTDLSETRSALDGTAFRETLAGSRFTTRYRTPFGAGPHNPTYTLHDGTYYRLGSVVVDEATVTHPVLRLRRADAGVDGVAASRLPEPDRVAVRVAHMAARARGNEGGVPEGLVRRGGYVYRDDDARDASRLLSPDGPDAVTYRERTYTVDVDREPFHEPVYRATVEPVAETTDRMEAILRARLVHARFDRDDLSRTPREVLRTARGDGYRETHPYSDGYRDVLKALHERVYLDGDIEHDALSDRDDRRLVRYDGEYYDYVLRFR